ncbi:MAG TPA: DUF4292 domain-containing protein [Saprospiraceae bacterium]|nr:DUF4292 domain-containing protein [Saprospiraceae bacterium]HHH55229.1 DUF4292 domain-containing protein [Bacteroidota bacterium]
MFEKIYNPNINKYALILLIFFSITSCRSKKNTIATKSTTQKEIVDKIKNFDIDYKWYKLKANVNVFMQGFSVSGQTEVRLKKDEFIWLNVKKFGIEFGRILIKPDSFFALDRYNKRYTAQPLDSLYSQYKIPFNFQDFQDIIVGNSMISKQQPLNFQNTKDGVLLKTTGDNFDILYKLNNGFNVSFMKLKDKSDNTVEIDFSDFKPQFQKEIPYIRKYSYPDNNEPKYFFKLDINKIEKDIPLKIKFEIPENYERF